MTSKLNLYHNIDIDIGKNFYMFYTSKGSSYVHFPVCRRCNYYYICVNHAIHSCNKLSDLIYPHDCFNYRIDNTDEILLMARKNGPEFRLLIGECINEDSIPGDAT